MDNVDVTRCEALEELVQKVRLFTISEQKFFLIFCFYEIRGTEDKERLFAIYRSKFLRANRAKRITKKRRDEKP